MPLRSTQTVVPQTKLRVNQPGDMYEQEADQVAERVMRMANPETPVSDDKNEAKKPLMRKQTSESGADGATDTSSIPPVVHAVLNSGEGQPLDTTTRAFMESRFEYDFSKVRVHTDSQAAESARAVNALAYTVGRDVVFGRGQYASATDEGRRLLAHELAHVVQQTGEASIEASPRQRNVEGSQREGSESITAVGIGRETGQIPSVQRVVELRPPGKGEQSAFGRVGELIDRLNKQSAAIQYRLDGKVLKYTVLDEATLTHFDRRMRAFIDRAEVVPMRLITKAGLVEGQPIDVDFFDSAYVDLDDLLASNDLSFQLNLIHLLIERFSVRNYARRIGTVFPNAEFDRAHNAGLEAETALLRDVVGDPTIKFNYEENKPNVPFGSAFRSDEGYRIFHVFRGAPGKLERHGEIFVQTKDGRRLTIEELIKERAAASASAP